MRPQRLMLLVLMGALVALPGCSADAGSGNVATAQSQGAVPPMDAFARCMRENGAPPLEGVSGGAEGGSGTSGESKLSPEDLRKQQEALPKCRQYLTNGGNPEPISTADLEKMRVQAKCMRDMGFNFPDPDGNSGGPGTIKLPEGIDLRDPVVLQKYRECSTKAGIGLGASGGPIVTPRAN